MAFNVLLFVLLITITSKALLEKTQNEDKNEDKKESISDNYFLNEDTSEWTDFGDMFSYDTNTKSNKPFTQTVGSQTDRVVDNECVCNESHISMHSSQEQQLFDNKCDDIFNKLEICEKDYKKLNQLTQSSTCNKRIVTFMRRAVLKLINKLKTFENELTLENKVQVSTFVSANSIQIIEEFVSQDLMVCQRVDQFEDALVEVIDSLYVVNNSEQTFLNNLIEKHSYKCLATISMILLVLFIYKLYCMSFYRRIVTIYGLIFMISFLWQWIQLYQIELSKKHQILSSAPLECIQLNNKELTITYIFRSYFTSIDAECEQYYRALMVDPILEVNPLEAISSALANALFKPISILGDQFGKGLSNFYNHFNFSTKILITFPLTLICSLILCLYMGYSIKFPYFLGSIIKNPELPPVQYSDTSNDYHNRRPTQPLRHRIQFNAANSPNRVLNDNNSRPFLMSSNSSNQRVYMKRSKSLTSLYRI